MTITQLNLANELNERIQKLQEQRNKYKKSFDVVCLFINGSANVSIEIKETNYKIDENEISILEQFPAKEFSEFLEHRIIKIDIQLEESKTKFKQL